MSLESAVDAWLRTQAGGTHTTLSWLNARVPCGGVVKINRGRYGPKDRTIEVFETQKFTTTKPEWTMNEEDWRRFWDFVENKTTYFTPGTYAKVKDNPDWRMIYGLAPNTLLYANKNGATRPVLVLETMACKKCGLVLPFSAITVDHQKPQSGGEDDALFKMFKVLGLTVADHAPKGRKGNYWYPEGLDLSFMTEPSTGWFNWAGVLFYTVLCSAQQEAEFSKVCIHHAINLAPMCLSCNSQKGNWGYR